MRVIAGRLRSRRLVAPAGMDVRPTSDRLRETIFNILAPRIEGARFLDLYAGTGAVAIEALSRGAAHATLVESNKRSARAIRENLAALSVEQESELIEDEVVHALRRVQQQFDIVFLDPPYSLHGQYDACLKLLSSLPLLAPASIVIAEHDKRFAPEESYGELKRYRSLVPGDSALSLWVP